MKPQVSFCLRGRSEHDPGTAETVLTACTLRLQNLEKGTTTFRNPKRSGEERQLLMEAGAELASLGANPQALQFFGLRWLEHSQFKGTLRKLRSWGLPVNMCPGHEQLEQNDHVLSSLFKRPPDQPQRRLVCAFDRTYIETSMQLMDTDEDRGSCWAGGAHRPEGFRDPDQSLLPLRRDRGPQQFSTKDITRASEMESFMTWDGTRTQTLLLELAAFPCLPGANLVPDVAFTGLSLLNLGLLMASERSKKTGVPLKCLWLDSRTHTSLKDLCGAVIIALYCADSRAAFHSMTERCLEKRFGRIRTSFPSSCMTAADYWRASAMVMRRHAGKLQSHLAPQVEPEDAISEDVFVAAASRAWQASLKLAAMCSGLTTTELQSTFNMTNGVAMCEAQMEAEADAPEDEEGHLDNMHWVFDVDELFHHHWIFSIDPSYEKY
eukprot:s4764_g2.t1